MNDEMREAFSEWWTEYLRQGGVTHFHIIADKESAIQGFQAAYQLQQKRIDELEERLRKITQPNIKDLNIELIGLKS